MLSSAVAKLDELTNPDETFVPFGLANVFRNTYSNVAAEQSREGASLVSACKQPTSYQLLSKLKLKSRELLLTQFGIGGIDRNLTGFPCCSASTITIASRKILSRRKYDTAGKRNLRHSVMVAKEIYIIA